MNKIPSRVPPKFSPTGSIHKILSDAFLGLYHPQQYLGSRLGQIVHWRNQGYLSFYQGRGFHPSHPRQKTESPSRASASSSRWICFEIPQHLSFIHYNLCICHSYTL